MAKDNVPDCQQSAGISVGHVPVNQDDSINPPFEMLLIRRAFHIGSILLPLNATPSMCVSM